MMKKKRFTKKTNKKFVDTKAPLTPNALREYRRGEFHVIQTLLVSYIQKCGKKVRAEKMVQAVFFGIRTFLLKNDSNDNSFSRFDIQVAVEDFVIRAVKRARPILFLRKIHRGRVAKLIPMPLYPQKQIARGVKQIVTAARKRRTEFGMVKKLLSEFFDLCDINKKPESLKMKETLYTLAVENKKNTRMIRFLKTATF